MKAWNRFFFQATDPTGLAVFRLAFGLLVFTMVLGIFPSRAYFYGADAIVLPETMDRFFDLYFVLFRFRWLPLHDPGMACFLVGVMIAALMLAFGVCTRLASVLVFVGIQCLHNRNYYILNAGDLLMRIDATVLVFADCGAALSFDRWWRVRRGKEVGPPRKISPWPVRLLQLQLNYLYLTTALLKLQGPAWRDGTALYYALRYLELQRFSFRYVFYYLWQVKLMTWGTIAGELAMGGLVWIRRLRYPLLLVAVGLHVGINLTMQFPVFQYVMLVNLLLFVYPEDWGRWKARLSR